MLDDLKFIHQRDSLDALGLAEKQYQQLHHSFEVTGDWLRVTDIANIVYSGMGGSALAAYLSETWPGHRLPFEVVRQYHLPKYVGPKTLVIVSSYSGNTEEELSTVAEAAKAGAQIVAIASNGQLAELAKAKNYPLLILPKVQEPRFAVLANLKAIAEILIAAGLSDKKDCQAEISSAAAFLHREVQAWLPTVPSERNPAKILAMEIAGKTPIIYGGPLMSPAAYKWKINFNENAKNVAFCNELPEFNHNEMIGWSSHPVQKPFEIINLISSFEDKRIIKRFAASEKLLSGRWPAPHNIKAKGSTVLEQLLWCVAYGDYVSIYLALINNQDPAPVDLIEKFKRDLE